MFSFRSVPLNFFDFSRRCSLLMSPVLVHYFLLKVRIHNGQCLSLCSGNDEELVWSKSPPWRILFFGSDSFAVKSLEMLCSKLRTGTLISTLDVVATSAVDWRKRHNPVYEFAKSEKLMIYNWPIVVNDIMHKYDIGVVVSFGYLIPENIIKSFPLGILNVHGSLLPKWRGSAPIIRAIMNGDTDTGITIMKINPGKFDTGDIVRQYSVTIGRNETAEELTNRMALLGARLLMECIRDLPRSVKFAVPQSREGVSYAKKINEATAEVHWDKQSAEDVYNQFRALNHIFPLTTTWFGVPIKLLHVELDYISGLNPENITNMKKLKIENKALPGLVEYSSQRNVLRIQCNDCNWVCVNKVLVSGKKTMTASQFFNGFLSKIKNSLDRRFGIQ